MEWNKKEETNNRKTNEKIVIFGYLGRNPKITYKYIVSLNTHGIYKNELHPTYQPEKM